MQLTAQNVEKLFAMCVRDEGAEIEGVGGKAILATAEHEAEIADLLSQLPTEFQRSGGGGWSFLNACMDKGGGQWTGMQPTMDKLFMLGIAAGKAKWLMPREMWDILPGGMPYVIVN
jgi:hypothetical protein